MAEGYFSPFLHVSVPSSLRGLFPRVPDNETEGLMKDPHHRTLKSNMGPPTVSTSPQAARANAPV